LATFYQSLGSGGNVEADTISTWVSGKPTGHGATNYLATNPSNAVGGLEVEDLERIRKHAPLSLRTLDRAVTLQDHIDIALLVPGVGKTAVYFDNSLKQLTFYIAPDGGGIAGTTLCNDLVDYFATRKMISTAVRALPCGESILRITLTATAKFRRSGADTKTDIENALLSGFGFNSSDINSDIRKSDIIALVDNLDKVDFLSLDILTFKPYPRVISGTHSISTSWYAIINSEANVKMQWKIFITQASSRTVRLYYKGVWDNDFIFDKTWIYTLTDPGAVNQTSNNGHISLAIWGNFSDGDEWQFTTYPYNQDIIFDDNTIPVTALAELSVTVNEQNI
jgi:hypothetical protein